MTQRLENVTADSTLEVRAGQERDGVVHAKYQASGRCHSRIEVLDDGRLRMHETWEWTSQPGNGTSVIEEIRPG